MVEQAGTMVAEGTDSEWEGLEDLRPGLRRYLWGRCRDENEVEDIVQETLVRAARYRRGLVSPARLRSWVTRIGANVLRDHARRAGKRPSVGHDEELFQGLECPGPVPGELREDDGFDLGPEVVDKSVLLAHVSRAFLGLFERDQRVLRSYYVGGMDSRSTARVCDIPPELVKVRLFRARRRLERAVRVRIAERRAERLLCGR
jgi:RNA polymerase sigma-70 factor (ECF subfamily)